MKLLHLGDLHLGKSLADFDLSDDQKYILCQILDIVKKEKVDTVLIAGDIYDKAIPSEAATNLLDFFLCELEKLKVNTFVISGNHDSDDRLNYLSSLLESKNIYISSVFKGTLYKQTINDKHGEVDVYLLPFVKASQVHRFYPEEEINSYEDAVRIILDRTVVDKKRRNILVAHQFVCGKSGDPVCAGSENSSVLNVGTIEKIGYDCFDDFDYVALGHIHSPQQVGREGIRYSGSPLKYSLSEVNNDKSVPIVSLDEKGKVNIELMPLKPMRDLRHIKGTMKQLLDKKNIKSPEDFIYVTLTDEDMINDAMGIFQQVYPYTVKINYDNSHTHELEQVDISKIVENKSFDEMIEDFYHLIYGCEMSEEEKAVMKEAAKKAGVVNEAD